MQVQRIDDTGSLRCRHEDEVEDAIMIDISGDNILNHTRTREEQGGVRGINAGRRLKCKPFVAPSAHGYRLARIIEDECISELVAVRIAPGDNAAIVDAEVARAYEALILEALAVEEARLNRPHADGEQQEQPQSPIQPCAPSHWWGAGNVCWVRGQRRHQMLASPHRPR